MTEIWNATDIDILREQFPSIFIFENMFTDEELREFERLENMQELCEICGWKGEGIHDDTMCNPEANE